MVPTMLLVRLELVRLRISSCRPTARLLDLDERGQCSTCRGLKYRSCHEILHFISASPQEKGRRSASEQCRHDSCRHSRCGSNWTQHERNENHAGFWLIAFPLKLRTGGLTLSKVRRIHDTLSSLDSIAVPLELWDLHRPPSEPVACRRGRSIVTPLAQRFRTTGTERITQFGEIWTQEMSRPEPKLGVYWTFRCRPSPAPRR
jgi:hypothetical protein